MIVNDKCPTCRAPAIHEGERYQFDSSRYHMDAVKKLSEMSALKGEIERLTAEVSRKSELLKTIDWLVTDDECGPKYSTYERLAGRIRHELARVSGRPCTCLDGDRNCLKHPDTVELREKQTCAPHGVFPCRDCGTTHYKGCKCYRCLRVEKGQEDD